MEIASTRQSQCRQLQIADWKTQILRDILALHFGEVAEWLKAALC
jgi:hypothetical protein